MADEKKGSGTAIIATVLVVSLVVAVSAIVIFLCVTNTGVQDNDTINVGQITVNNPSCSAAALSVVTAPKKPAAAAIVKPVQAVTKPVVKPVQAQPAATVQEAPAAAQELPQDNSVRIPTFRAMDESEEMATISGKPAGIMNASSEAQAKKWDPEKNFPSRNKPRRPEGTLGAQFGPDETEIQMNLPTPEELFAARGHVSGPKFIRSGNNYKRDNFFRPTMIPSDYDDYDRVRRPNRPRINENHYKSVIEQEKRFFGNGYSGIVAPY